MDRRLLVAIIVVPILFSGCLLPNMHSERFTWTEPQSSFEEFPESSKHAFSIGKSQLLLFPRPGSEPYSGTPVMPLNHSRLPSWWSPEGSGLYRVSRGDFFLYYGTPAVPPEPQVFSIMISYYRSEPTTPEAVRAEFASFVANVTAATPADAQAWSRVAFPESDRARMAAAAPGRGSYVQHVRVDEALRLDALFASMADSLPPSYSARAQAPPPSPNPELCSPYAHSRCPSEGRPTGPTTVWIGDWTWEFAVATATASMDPLHLTIGADGHAVFMRTAPDRIGPARLEQALQGAFRDLGLPAPAPVERDYDHDSYRYD